MRGNKTLLLVAADICIIWVSIVGAYLLWHQSLASLANANIYVYASCTTLVTIAFMMGNKLYQRIWRYASVGELLALFRSVLISSFISIGAAFLITGNEHIVVIGLLASQTILLLMGGMRFGWRLVRDRYMKTSRFKPDSNLLIIGAGDCGMLIARELKGNPDADARIAAFIDDDPKKQGNTLLGIPVIGGREKIYSACRSLDIDKIIIAMPSVSKKVQSEMIDLCNVTKVKVQIVPAYHDILTGRAVLQQIRDVQVEDLLGRDPVDVDLKGIADYVSGKTVLVTGAGGSIGSELCRQIASFQPEKLLLLGHGENSIYLIHSELLRTRPDLQTETIIADVQDYRRMEEVFERFRPEIVFHAAAHKHVPLMERNPMEAVKNNVFGTKNVAMCAKQFESERFVLISTDKAVNPTSVMGTTKRMAEKIVMAMNDDETKTKFCAVRFGNVLGSRGSVIPHFKKQIAEGGPVTVTDPEMVRYFMTIPEAVQLVIQAGAYTEGGEVFVLDMGEPVKIVKLAEDLIKLSGFEPYVDIPIVFTGIRPGEKLYEELLTAEEGLTSTKHERIFIGQPERIEMSDIMLQVARLEKLLLAETNNRTVSDTLKQFVPEYLGAS